MPKKNDESGAALILAIVMLFAIGILLMTISDFAGASAVTTYNLRAERTAEMTAENAITTAVSQVRSNPDLCAASPSYLSNHTVFCSQVINIGALNTRTVDFYACPNATAANPCSVTNTGEIVHAVVVFGDVPPNNPSGSVCTPGHPPYYTCGITASIQSWDVKPADT